MSICSDAVGTQMLRRFLLYGMPCYILGIELALRALLAFQPGRVEEASLVLSGPSIALGGITLVLPVLTPKPVPVPSGVPANVRLINKSDQRLIEAATIAFFVMLALWAFSIYLCHPVPPSKWSILIGLGCYIFGIFFTEWKEVV